MALVMPALFQADIEDLAAMTWQSRSRSVKFRANKRADPKVHLFVWRSGCTPGVGQFLLDSVVGRGFGLLNEELPVAARGAWVLQRDLSAPKSVRN
jgi:hypothetical protein